MKTETLIIAGAAAVGLLLVYKMTSSGAATQPAGTKDTVNAGGQLQIVTNPWDGTSGFNYIPSPVWAGLNK